MPWVVAWCTAADVAAVLALSRLLLAPSATLVSCDYTAAVALASAGVLCAVISRTFEMAWLRYGAVVLAAGAVGMVARGAGFDATDYAVTALCVAGASTVGALAAWRIGRGRWIIAPLAAMTAIASIVAVLAGAVVGAPLCAMALAVAGVEVAAFAVALDEVSPAIGTPILFLSSWVVLSWSTFDLSAEFYTIPLGVSLIAVCELARWSRRRRGLNPRENLLVICEYTGMTSLVIVSFVQEVATSLLHGLVIVLVGLLIGVWGLLTRVRRRVAFSAGAVTLAVVLMIVVPIAWSVPNWRGATLWIALAVIGLVAIFVAAFLERSITLVREILSSLRRRTAEWE
jgi:hypothetical protein